jgi:hypothetical protein
MMNVAQQGEVADEAQVKVDRLKEGLDSLPMTAEATWCFSW